MSIKSQESQRAKFAYDAVCEYRNWIKGEMEGASDEDKKKLRSCYISYVKAVPSYIKINGLIATLAFIKDKKAKNDNGKNKIEPKVYGKIYSIIDQWLESQGLVENSPDFIEQIFALSSNSYKLVTTEVLSLFGWLKRFAESELSE